MILRNSERLWVTLMSGFEQLGGLRLTKWGPPCFVRKLLVMASGIAASR